MKIKKTFAVVVSILFLIFFVICSKNPADSSDTEEPGKTENGYFFITWPRFDTRVNLDSSFIILWIASNKVVDSPNVRISLYKDSSFLRTLSSSTPNSGSFKYLLNRIGSGTGYQIKISTYPDTSKFDFSGYFQIYSDYSGTITITYPSAKTKLMMGTSDTLRWETTEFPGPRLRLDLYCDTSFLFTIVEGMATTLDKYPWSEITTPLGTNNRYRIKATSEKDESLSNYSDYFTIASIYNGGFTIKAPSSSTEWSSGNKYSILWDTTGSPGETVILQLYTDDKLYSTIASNATNNGKYEWTPKKGMVSGSEYRIKIISSEDAAFSDFSSSFTINGIDADRYEPDNNKSTAHLLAFDTLENRSIFSGDTDWVNFTADSGCSYLILSKGDSGFQISCKLYSGTDSTVFDSNSSLTDGRLSWFWPCEKSSKYFARITADENNASGKYTFGIYRFIPSELVTFSTPTASTKLKAGSTTTIKWAPDSLIFGLSVKLYLYKGAQRMISLSSEQLPNSGRFEWEIPEGFLSGDDYSLYLENGSYASIYGKGPTFSIEGLSPDQFENDNNRKNAADLTIGDFQEHSISLNDTDWVRFSATLGTRYIIMLQCTDTFTASMSLFRDTLSQVLLTGKTEPNNYFSIIWNCPATAKYYVRINASGNKLFGDYKLKFVPFDSLSSLTFLSPVSAMLLVRGAQTKISWIQDSLITGDSISISLYKGSSALQVLKKKQNADSATYIWNISDTLRPGNDYRIKITNTEKLSFCGFSPKFIISDLKPDSFENDGTSSKASLIYLDSMQYHNITISDTDFIKFTADSGTQYLLTTTGQNQFRISGSLYLTASSSPSLTFTSNTNGISNTLWNCKSSGVYYMRINAVSSTGTGGYSFRIGKYDPEKIVTFHSPVSTTSWPVDSTVTISWDPVMDLFGTKVTLLLYQNSGRLLTIVSKVENSGSYDWKIPPSLSTGSDYRVHLVNSSDTLFKCYSSEFTINGMPGDEYETDDSWSQARLYTTGVTEYHNITYNDTDWVKFPADSGYIYYVQIKGENSFGTDIAIYYENNWQDSSGYSSVFSNKITEMWQCRKSTTVYVKITNNRLSSSVTGAYHFTITKFDPTRSITFISPSSDTVIEEGTTLNLQWIPDSTFLGNSVQIYLYKMNTEISSYAISANSGQKSLTIPKKTLTTGSDYRIKIENMFYEEFYGYSPFLTITGIDSVPDVYENDNACAMASNISIDSEQEHNLINNDTDWIQFQMQAGEQYVLMVDRFLGTLNLRIHQGSAKIIDVSTYSGQIRRLLTAESDGHCFIEISQPTSKLYSTYIFRVTRFDSSDALKITSPTEGTVVVSGEKTPFTWTCDTVIYGNKVDISLYEGSKLITAYSSNNTGSYSFYGNGLISGSNYRIKISSTADPLLYAYSPYFTVSGIKLDDYEPDNSPENASVIISGGVQLHNYTMQDTDWVKFSAQSGSSYIFVHEKNQNNEMKTCLYDSSKVNQSGSHIFSEYIYGGSDTMVFYWKCEKNGAYYINIYPNSSSATGDYQLKLIQFDSSQNIEFTNPTEGIAWVAGSTNQITWLPNADNIGPLVYLELYKGNKPLYFLSEIPNNGSYSMGIGSNIENGEDYRIRISSLDQSKTYSYYSPEFSVTGGIGPDSFEPDNIKESASAISIDDIQHHTLTTNDSDWIKFEADSGITYNIVDSTNSTRLKMSIYFSNNDSEIAGFEILKGESVTEWSCTRKGIYFIKMAVYKSTTQSGIIGRYSISITTE